MGPGTSGCVMNSHRSRSKHCQGAESSARALRARCRMTRARESHLSLVIAIKTSPRVGGRNWERGEEKRREEKRGEGKGRGRGERAGALQAAWERRGRHRKLPAKHFLRLERSVSPISSLAARGGGCATCGFTCLTCEQAAMHGNKEKPLKQLISDKD